MQAGPDAGSPGLAQELFNLNQDILTGSNLEDDGSLGGGGGGAPAPDPAPAPATAPDPDP